MARGLYYSSFSLNHVWLIGCRILLVLPITISYMWNFGSLLGMCLILQILRKNILDQDSQRPFECGFSTFINYRLRFRLHFFGRFSIYHFWCWTNYSVSLFFRSHYHHFIRGLFMFIRFLRILTLGLFNEWNQSVLEWQK